MMVAWMNVGGVANSEPKPKGMKPIPRISSPPSTRTHVLRSSAVLHLALCSAASAALTAYDGFDYGAASGDLTGKNGGPGWSGAYTDSGNSTVYITTGLSYGTLETSGGASLTADGGAVTTLNFRNTGTTYGDDEAVTWISFLAQRNGAASASTFAGLSFYNNGGIAAGNAEFSISNAGVGGTWRLFDNGTSTTVSTSTTIASNTTYLLVARISWGAGAGGTDAVSLFVNPTLGIEPGVADASRDISMTNFDKVRIAGANAVNYTFDEIRVGDSFASVTPVPETSTSAALILGLSSLGFRRRRAF